MIKLNIEGKELKVPNKLKEIPLYRIQEIYSMSKDMKEYSYNDKIILCSTIFGLEPNIFFNISEDSINQIFSNINFLNNTEEEIYFTKTFNLKGTNFGLTDLNTLSVYEYVEIESIINESDTPFESLDKIISVLCRKIVKKNKTIRNILFNVITKLMFKGIIPKSYSKYIIKKYEDSDLDNAEYFGRNMDAAFGMAIFNMYIEYKKDMQLKYPNIFVNSVISKEDKDQYDEEPDEPLKKAESFETIWGLYHVIDSISSNIFERDEWYKREIKELFTYMTYTYQKNDYLNKMNMQHGH
jgi:hypothetical protein